MEQNRFCAYGEDGLTLRALTTQWKILEDRLVKVLMGDPECDKNSALRICSGIKKYYRPSFGRGPSCHGEFDAILWGETHVFLLESKWLPDGTLEKSKKTILKELREGSQASRHLWMENLLKRFIVDNSPLEQMLDPSKVSLFRQAELVCNEIRKSCGNCKQLDIHHLLLAFVGDGSDVCETIERENEIPGQLPAFYFIQMPGAVRGKSFHVDWTPKAISEGKS